MSFANGNRDDSEITKEEFKSAMLSILCKNA
jgi:hypothetical protein